MIENKVEFYREITSDLFMCGIMGLTMFGYLVVMVENLKIRKENIEIIFKRLFVVLECLSEVEKDTAQDNSEFGNGTYA